MLSKKEVQHIAKLARLGLTEKEIKRFQKELSSILDYIEKLKEVDVSKIESASHTIKIAELRSSLVLRYARTIEDAIRADESEEPKLESKELLELAPETKDDYLKTKSILK